MNVVLCGPSGSGKSTAIRAILRRLGEPVYGFWTEKLAPDADGNAAVYLHGCREPLTYAEDHRIGTCRERMTACFPMTFDTLGVRFLQDIPQGGLVLMDEIGVMERDAQAFIRAIFALLDGDYRVLMAVRDRRTPLLDAVRSHPKSLCIAAADARKPSVLQAAAAALQRQNL